MKWVCWGGMLCDFSPLVMELQNPLVSSNGKDSRTQQLDGSKEAAGEVTVSEGKPPHYNLCLLHAWKIAVRLTSKQASYS